MNKTERALDFTVKILATLGLLFVTSAQIKNLTKKTTITKTSISRPDSNAMLQELMSKQTSTIQTHKKVKKLKIGIIDIGGVDWSQLPTVAHKEVIFPNPDRQTHGHFVTQEIIKPLELSKNLNQVEIIFCEIQLGNMSLIPCLKTMVKEKIDILNLSMSFSEGATYPEIDLLNEISNKAKIVVAAGNSGLNSENMLCNLAHNKICVGGYGANGEIHNNSSYGQNVDTYESFHAHYSDNNGTSFSAPIHVAKIAKLLLNGQDFDYKHNQVTRTLAATQK